MNKLRNIFTYVTLLLLALAVLEIKSFLNDNFIENDTPVKRNLNKFLNGEVPAKKH